MPSIIFQHCKALYFFLLSDYLHANIVQHFDMTFLVAYFGLQTDKLIAYNNITNFLCNDLDYFHVYSYSFDNALTATNYIDHISKCNGFEISRNDGIKSNHVRFQCKLKHNDCPFSIYLKKTKHGIYQITSANLSHNHLVDPQLTFHKLATAAQIDLIRSFKECNIKNTVIAKIMGSIYGSNWSNVTTRQIRSLCYSRTCDETEIEELDRLIKSNNGKIMYFPSIDNPLAIFTATEEEINNGTDFGDVLVIDGTNYPNRNDFEIVPVTCFDKCLHIRSAGTLFTKSSIREVYKFLIDCLLEFCSIITIISDEESGIVSIMDHEFSMLAHIICAWHKRKNIIRQMNLYFKDMDSREEIVRCIDTICYSYDKGKVDNAIQFLSQLNSPGFVKYLNENVIPILNKFSPAYITIFCLGKNVSSAGESANSLIKSTVSSRYYRLAQIKSEIIRLFKRKEISEIDRTVYRRSIYCSKFKSMFNIDLNEEILKLLDYSMDKSDRLEFFLKESTICLHDPVKDKTHYVECHDNLFFCDCRKQLVLGLPCSHILKLCTLYNCSPISYISPRYGPIGGIPSIMPIPISCKPQETIIKLKRRDSSKPKLNYATLLNKCKDIIKKIEKNDDLVNAFLDTLNTVEAEFNLKVNPKPDTTTNKGSPAIKRFKAFDE